MFESLRDYTTIDPYPVEKMNFHNRENTICELLRQTYHLTDNDKIRTNLRIAITMAKKMGDKLHNYREVRKGRKQWKDVD
jgi:DNA-binding XRE family transcriptional regulator